jgi:hypothetical protein
MHNHHQAFIDALIAQRKIVLTFLSKEDHGPLERICAPLDYGPSRRATDRRDRYHMWDYDSDTTPHVLSLLPEHVIRIATLDDTFDPADIVTWDLTRSPWFFPRHWGRYS